MERPEGMDDLEFAELRRQIEDAADATPDPIRTSDPRAKTVEIQKPTAPPPSRPAKYVCTRCHAPLAGLNHKSPPTVLLLFFTACAGTLLCPTDIGNYYAPASMIIAAVCWIYLVHRYEGSCPACGSHEVIPVDTPRAREIMRP